MNIVNKAAEVLLLDAKYESLSDFVREHFY